MLATTVFMAALASVAGAFTLPAGAVDGFYRAYINETGHEVHELLARDLSPRGPSPAVTAGSAPRLLESRPPTDFWVTWCGCGIGLNHADCDAAVQNLKNQLGDRSRIEAHLAFYAIRGSVVAFACNNSGSTAVIGSEGVRLAAEHVTNACGWYIGLHPLDTCATPRAWTSVVMQSRRRVIHADR